MEVEKVNESNASSSSHERRFNIFWLLESVCILGMNTLNTWEVVMKNLKKYINESDMEMLSIFESLTSIYEYLKGELGVEENSQLKFLSASDYKFNFQELNSLLQNLYETSDIKKKLFSPQASHCIIQIIRSLLYQQLSQQNQQLSQQTQQSKQQQEQQQQKQSHFKKSNKRKYSCNDSSDSSDDDDEFDKLFSVKKSKNKKRKNKDVIIKQLLQLNSDRKKKIMKTPGETGSHLIKIEITDMNDLRNTPEKQYWTKVHKKAYFVLDEKETESEEILNSINNVLIKIGNILTNIPNVDIQVDKTNRDKNMYY